MKKHIIILLILTPFIWNIPYLASSAKANNSFMDVPEDTWMYPYIKELTNDGIVSGYEDGKFYPWKNANRAEVAKMIVLMKTKIQGNWLQNHFIEIILVLATVVGWISILNSFKKNQNEFIKELRKTNSASFNSQEEQNTKIIHSISNKNNQEDEKSNAIEKNLKSNWWV